MTSDTADIRIAIESSDRRGLIARFCHELGSALAASGDWERGDAVVPWHATTATFAELPAHIAAAVLAEWEEADAVLSGIEFSGYIETDHGPRAWGYLVVHEATSAAARPDVEVLLVEKTDMGFALQADLHLEGASTDA